MQIQHLLLILFVSSFYNLHAQPEVEWLETKESTSFSFLTMEGETEEHIYFLERNIAILKNNSNITIHQFEKSSLKYSNTKVLSEGMSRGEMVSAGSIVLGDQLYSYRGLPSSNGKGMTLGMTELEAASMSEKGNSLTINPLLNTKTKDFISSLTAISPNGKYTAIYTFSQQGITVGDYARSSNLIGLIMSFFKRSTAFYVRDHAVTVFDENGKAVWSSEYTLGEKGLSINPKNVSITDNGEVFIMADESTSNSRLQEINPNVYDKDFDAIYFLNSKDFFPTKLSIDWGIDPEANFNIGDYKILENENDFYLAASCTKDMKKGDLVLGVYVLKFNDKGEQVDRTFFPTDLSFFRDKLSKEEKRKLDKGKSVKIGAPLIQYFDIKEGEFVIGLEEYTLIKKTTTTINQTTGTTSTSTDYDFHYGNFVLFQGDKENNVKWKSIIEKDQYLESRFLEGSAFVHKTGHQFFIVYNGDADGRYRSLRDGVNRIHVVVMNSTGAIEKDNVIQYNGSPIIPKSCFSLSDNYIFLNGNDGKKRDFGVLKL